MAKVLGLNATMVGRWYRGVRRRGHKAFPGTGTSHDQESARLKREIALVIWNRCFLKEAALSSTSHCNTGLSFLRWRQMPTFYGGADSTVRAPCRKPLMSTSPDPFPWENTAEATGWYFHSCPVTRDCADRKNRRSPSWPPSNACAQPFPCLGPTSKNGGG